MIINYKQFVNTYTDKNQAKKIAKQYLPIKVTDKIAKEYAYLIGKVIGDGNLDNRFTIRLIGQKEDLEIIRKHLINTFKLNPSSMKIRQKQSIGISYVLQINKAFFGRILYLLGAPIGNKTLQPFKVPTWIIQNKRLSKYFLQAILEDELTTIKIQRKNYSNNPIFKMAKSKQLNQDLLIFMSQIKQIIESFDIECGKISPTIKTKTPEKIDMYFRIQRNKQNILKFQKEIGFRFNQNKIRELNKCCKIIKKSITTSSSLQ